MDETLQEFVDSRAVEMRVDRERGIIRGVKLLGLESRNGRRYLPTALERAAALYEGAKVNVNHPKGHPLAARDYEERLGLLRNVRWKANQGLFGDLHFNPKHNLAEQLAWDAEHAPENVGLSHNVQARTQRDADQLVIETILKVQSVDLVADPATTRGLFESRTTAASATGQGLTEVTLERLQAARPDLVEQLEESLRLQLTSLAKENDELRAREAARDRRELTDRLLREYKLPNPDRTDPLANAVVSQTFLETLLAAPSEDEMRKLVADRSALVHGAGGWADQRTTAKPSSREQFTVEDTRLAESDLQGFVKAITQA